MIEYTESETKIQHFGRNVLGRDFATGDIHGNFNALLTSLDAIGFDRERDRLFGTGDLVDRGNKSHEVEDLLERPWFFSVQGNHDLMAWRNALGCPFLPVRHEDHGGEWLAAMSLADRRRIGSRLRALPTVIEIETSSGIVSIIHADFPFDDYKLVTTIDWNDQERLGSEASICLWSSSRIRRRYAVPVTNVRAIVHGHTTVSEMLQLGNLFFIDTGGWRSAGAFTFLELDRLEAVTGPRGLGDC